MKSKSHLRFTLTDQYGSQAVIDGGEVDRATEQWGLQRLLESFYDDIPATSCPVCGTSVAQAVETGLMGCPACYEFVYPGYRAQIAKNAASSGNSGNAQPPDQVS